MGRRTIISIWQNPVYGVGDCTGLTCGIVFATSESLNLSMIGSNDWPEYLAYRPELLLGKSFSGFLVPVGNTEKIKLRSITNFAVRAYFSPQMTLSFAGGREGEPGKHAPECAACFVREERRRAWKIFPQPKLKGRYSMSWWHRIFTGLR